MTYSKFLQYVSNSNAEIANEFAQSKFVRPVPFLKKYIFPDKVTPAQVVKFYDSREYKTLVATMRMFKSSYEKRKAERIEDNNKVIGSSVDFAKQREDFENAMIKSEERDEEVLLKEMVEATNNVVNSVSIPVERDSFFRIVMIGFAVLLTVIIIMMLTLI